MDGPVCIAKPVKVEYYIQSLVVVLFFGELLGSSLLIFLSALPFSVAGVFIRRIFEMTDPNPWPHVDYGRNTNRADVLIIGAGISGMVTAIDMIRKGNGRNFIIVEKGNQVGGTWNDQRYPGCCCDSRSPFPLS